MSIVITSYIPNSCNIYGGGIFLINGTGLTAAAVVSLAGVKSPDVQFIDNGDGTETLYAQIPPTMTAGSKALVVGGVTAGNVAAKNPTVFKPDFPYDIQVNGNNVTGLQKDRITLSQNMNIIDTYTIGFNSVIFEVPADVRLNRIPSQNNVVVRQNGVVYFQGYPSGEVINELTQMKKITCTPFYNLLSKIPVTSADSVVVLSAQNILNKFAEVVSLLPKQYNVFPWILNASELDGIYIGINTGGSSNTYSISLFQPIFDLLHISLFIWNNTIYLYAVPSNLLIHQGTPIEDLLVTPPESIECMDTYYYNYFIFSYSTTPGGASTTATSGGGSLLKKLSCSDIFMDSNSAQNAVDRNNSILSQIWKKTNFSVSREMSVKIGDILTYKDYVFIVTGVTEKYTCFDISAIGQKKE